MIYAPFISFVAILYKSQKSKYIFFLVSINHHFENALNFWREITFWSLES